MKDISSIKRGWKQYTLLFVLFFFITFVSADGGGWTNTSTQTTTSLNVGIGAASPATSLQITGPNTANRGQLSVVGAGGAGAQLTFYSDPTFTAAITGNSNNLALSTQGTWPIVFYPNNVEAMRLTNGGNVGIGTTTPATLLDVAGPIRFGNYTKSALPAAGTSGRLARVNDDTRGLWMDQGTQWFSLSGEVVNVKEFGAKGDGATDDTAAFNTALAAANKTRPLFLPPGNYIISNLTLQGTSSGGGEEGKAFGIIGSGVGTTTITASGGSGVFIQVGASTDSAVGYRRFVMRDLKIVGNSGYSEGVKIGNYNSGSPVIILGEMRNIETTGFSAVNASGVFLQNAVGFTINNLYSYSNYFGIKMASVDGIGEVTTINIQNSQFRLNTYGAAIFQAIGVSTYNNVYESNTQWGLIIKSFTGLVVNNDHLFMREWFEGNTNGSVLITSNNPPGVISPASITFINGVFNKGTDRAIRIQDGSDITFIGSHIVGSTPKIAVESVVPRVNFIDGFFAGASPFSVSDYNDITNEWRPLYTQDVSGAVAGRYLRGVLEINPVNVNGTGLQINRGGSVNISGETKLGGVASDGTGQVVCVKSDGYLGTCKSAVLSSGKCNTCT